MTPTAEQEAIYGAVADGNANVMVNAVAGSGKTTTAVEAARRNPGTTGFVAFNKAIVEELQRKLGDAARATTLHSAGNRMIRDALGRYPAGPPGDDVNRKRREHMERVAPNAFRGRGTRSFLREEWEALPQVVDHIRTQVADGGSDRDRKVVRDRLADDGYFDPPDDLYDKALDVVDSMAGDLDRVDFTDMLYLPVRYGWNLLHLYDTLFVDECQDLNPLQHRLVLGMAPRHVYVGDPRQAIMAFAGADCDSFDNLERILGRRPGGVAPLPLSCCWRCPTSGIDLASILVPAIRASPTAVEGVVTELGYEPAVGRLEAGHLLVCRRNAPLVRVAFRLIQGGVAFLIRGRAFGDGLVRLMKKLAGNGIGSAADLAAAARVWEAAEVAKLQAAEAPPGQVGSVQDRADCVFALCTSDRVGTVADALDLADRLFSDSAPGGRVILSSIHRAKGLEADHVTVLDPGYMPMGRGTSREQDVNLLYVALTRHKRTLTLVDDQVHRVGDTEAWLRNIAAGATGRRLTEEADDD